jgi:hypothetical protein
MELIAYIGALVIYFNIFGAAALFLEFIRLEIAEVLSNVRGSGKTKGSINRKAN